ncbi:MAG: hypothetical protein KDE48_08875 [Anaerolineales bacterium]|nr:hypothetical protein [Anaerolineales bacterium]
MKENLNIALFHQLMNSNETPKNTLLDALRSLTQLDSKNSVRDTGPQLGAWSGWSA